MPGEFAFIDRLRARVPALPPGWIGVGDDAALVPTPGSVLVAVDAVVDGVHLELARSGAAAAGWKALAVNLSDLAAMGGGPLATVAAVTVPPAADATLADGVLDGLLAAAQAHGCPLVGGDTTSGPVLVISVTVLGTPPPGGAVTRAGGRAGDAVLVTGTLGGPAAAVRARAGGRTPDPTGARRLDRPEPRLRHGAVAAACGATAMVDVSDGLVADLGHVADESGCGFELDLRLVPLGPAATDGDALAGGDDYELVICTPDPARLLAACAAAGLEPPTAIGRLTRPVEGRLVLGRDGTPLEVLPAGWDHDLGRRR